MALLEVRDLRISAPLATGSSEAVRGIDLTLDPGERLGLVGETGAGGDLIALSLLGLLPAGHEITAGAIRFDKRNLLAMPRRQRRQTRGKRIAMIFRDAVAALHPGLSVGRQMVETLKAHGRIDDGEAKRRALEALRAAEIPVPERCLQNLPADLPAASCQRVAIAITFLTKPDIVIADAPMAGLGVTAQASIMALIRRLSQETGAGLILVTPDLGIAAEVTERLMILHAGRAVEEGPTRAVIDAPRHPYTAGLVRALPQPAAPGTRLVEIPGAVPQPGAIPRGCAYNPRCERAYAGCFVELPELEPAGDRRRVACMRPLAAEATP